ncbi:hypothetical protein ACQP2P_25660 [Dactylosporangium sp. CA-139114]|uniref:hypothetical protein n=1 Tax=Dactylosporangium sp. CA-139114 TaxID=3239931 RepID=UPI003D9A044F
MTEYRPRAAVLRLPQRLAAVVPVAAVTGVVLAAPASLAGHRTALLHGAPIRLGLIVLALAFALADRAEPARVRSVRA